MSIRKVGVLPLLSSVTTTGASSQQEPFHTNRSFEAYGATSAGAGAATIKIQVRNSEDADWKDLGTITLTLSTTTSGDGFVTSAAWRYVRANVTAISGTDATVSVNMGTAPL